MGFFYSVVLIGREPTPAIKIQALLGESRCNNAKIGGEVSAYSTKD